MLYGTSLVAYHYAVYGKLTLESVVEWQVVKTDKEYGIVNNANDYANETVGKPRYPMVLIQRLIAASIETRKIVNGLTELEID